MNKEQINEILMKAFNMKDKIHLDVFFYDKMSLAIQDTWQKAQDSIQCESCGRKDCLNILCHADLEIIKQDVEKKAQDEILDKVEILCDIYENESDFLPEDLINRLKELRNRKEKIE
jgi:hypothetical protein